MPKLAWEACLASIILILSVFAAAPATAQGTEECVESVCVAKIDDDAGEGTCEDASFHSERWGVAVTYNDGSDSASAEIVRSCFHSEFGDFVAEGHSFFVDVETGGQNLPTVFATASWSDTTFGSFESCSVSVLVFAPGVGFVPASQDCPADLGPGDVLPTPSDLP